MKKNVWLIPMLALLTSCGGGNNDTSEELLYGHAFVQSGTYIDHESETLNWLTENISNIKFGNDDTCARMEYQVEGKKTFYLAKETDADDLLVDMKKAVGYELDKLDMFHMFIINSDKTTGEMQLKADGRIIPFALKVSVTIGSPSGESLDFTSYTEIGDIDGTISIARRNNDQIDCTDIKIYAYSAGKTQYFENKVTFYFPLTNQADGDPVYTVNGWFNFSPVRVK